MACKDSSISSKSRIWEHAGMLLIDKFVTEMHDKIFDRLCEEGATLTLSKALEIAQRYEKPETEGRQRNPVSSKEEVYDAAIRCYHCGKQNHDLQVCKFKFYLCNKSGKKGYLAAVCRSHSGKSSFVFRNQ